MQNCVTKTEQISPNLLIILKKKNIFANVYNPVIQHTIRH